MLLQITNTIAMTPQTLTPTVTRIHLTITQPSFVSKLNLLSSLTTDFHSASHGRIRKITLICSASFCLLPPKIFKSKDENYEYLIKTSLYLHISIILTAQWLTTRPRKFFLCWYSDKIFTECFRSKLIYEWIFYVRDDWTLFYIFIKIRAIMKKIVIKGKWNAFVLKKVFTIIFLSLNTLKEVLWKWKIAILGLSYLKWGHLIDRALSRESIIFRKISNKSFEVN